MGRQFHRPTLFGPAAIDAQPGGPDPADREEIAHGTARVLLLGAREDDADPAAVQRLLRLVDEYGVELLADLWSSSPARSLAGALWRLYLLHTWVRRNPREAAGAFDAGRGRAPVHEVVAGVADPPGPEQVSALVDDILRGAYRGDFAVALERAAAFARVVAVGRTIITCEDVPAALSSARLTGLAEDLESCARLWRAGDLQAP